MNKKLATLLVLTTLILGMFPVITAFAPDTLTPTLYYKEGGEVSTVDYGDVIIAKGAGSTAGYDIKLYWDYVQAWDGEAGLLNTTKVGSDGNYEVWFEVPEAVAGEHYVWVEDTKTGDTASTDLTVVPLVKLSKSSGLAGDDVTVSAYGLGSENYATIVFSTGTSLTGTLLTEDSGEDGTGAAADYSFTLANTPVVPGSVGISDESNTNQYTDDGSGNIIDSNEDEVGTIDYHTGEIELNDVAFVYGEDIGVVYRHLKTSTTADYVFTKSAESNTLGSLTYEAEIPSKTEATYYIHVFDSEGNSDYEAFTIGPVITLDVDEGPTGTVVEIRGRGFDGDYVLQGGIKIQDEDKKYGEVEVTILNAVTNVDNNDNDGIEIEEDGDFRLEVVIPIVWTTGMHEITVTSSAGGNDYAIADFNVTALPELTVEPEYGTQGSKVTVSGSNFPQLSGKDVTFELWPESSFTANIPLGTSKEW